MPLKSMNDVLTLSSQEAALYIERNPTLVKSITSVPLNRSGHSDMEVGINCLLGGVPAGATIPIQSWIDASCGSPVLDHGQDLRQRRMGE